MEGVIKHLRLTTIRKKNKNDFWTWLRYSEQVSFIFKCLTPTIDETIEVSHWIVSKFELL